MSPSDAQKRASAKYQKDNIASLACRVKQYQAEKFKTYCHQLGKTSNAVLREYVLNCIGEPETMNGVTLLTDAQILARLRSRLRKVNEKICKLKQKTYDGDDLYRVLPIDDDPKDYVDDEHGVYTLNKLIDYVEKRDEDYACYKQSRK